MEPTREPKNEGENRGRPVTSFYRFSNSPQGGDCVAEVFDENPRAKAPFRNISFQMTEEEDLTTWANSNQVPPEAAR